MATNRFLNWANRVGLLNHDMESFGAYVGCDHKDHGLGCYCLGRCHGANTGRTGTLSALVDRKTGCCPVCGSLYINIRVISDKKAKNFQLSKK